MNITLDFNPLESKLLRKLKRIHGDDLETAIIAAIYVELRKIHTGAEVNKAMAERVERDKAKALSEVEQEPGFMKSGQRIGDTEVT